MLENQKSSVVIIGLGIALDEAAIQTLDNFVNNGTHGSTREDACRAFICNKVGMDAALADPDNQPEEAAPAAEQETRSDTPMSEAVSDATPDPDGGPAADAVADPGDGG